MEKSMRVLVKDDPIHASGEALLMYRHCNQLVVCPSLGEGPEGLTMMFQ